MIYSNPKHMFHTGGIVESLKSAKLWVFPKKILKNVQSIRWRGDNKVPTDPWSRGTDRPLNSKAGKYL